MKTIPKIDIDNETDGNVAEVRKDNIRRESLPNRKEDKGVCTKCIIY